MVWCGVVPITTLDVMLKFVEKVRKYDLIRRNDYYADTFEEFIPEILAEKVSLKSLKEKMESFKLGENSSEISRPNLRENSGENSAKALNKSGQITKFGTYINSSNDSDSEFFEMKLNRVNRFKRHRSLLLKTPANYKMVVHCSAGIGRTGTGLQLCFVSTPKCCLTVFSHFEVLPKVAKSS